ncbi:hypothetical protein CFP56_033981 [Quercus suber]|uniref:Uncharacterized protein n=1 Tax=Quercus suber TaxID=58331 RepID=A0AAW0JDT8_QUESU
MPNQCWFEFYPHMLHIMPSFSDLFVSSQLPWQVGVNATFGGMEAYMKTISNCAICTSTLGHHLPFHEVSRGMHGIYRHRSRNQGDVCQCGVIFATHGPAQYFHSVFLQSVQPAGRGLEVKVPGWAQLELQVGSVDQGWVQIYSHPHEQSR